MREHRTIVKDFLAKTSGCGIYNRYPDISDRKAWDSIPKEYKNNLVKAGEEAQNEPWTQLLISDFFEFSKSGNRVRFEDKYFPRRRKLNKLVMAECVENKGRFIEDILDGLYLILEETSWCLPPHNSYERDAKQENLPDPSRPVIDLFQAESGAEVAFTEYLLRPVFDKINPFISKYVNDSLNKRIFIPYLNQHFWWMGNGKESMCNWTPWITQNVLICALSRKEDFFTGDVRRKFIEKAAVSCDYFLDEYGEDGGCNEGAAYYSHAGLCLFGCLELIDGAVLSRNSAIGINCADTVKTNIFHDVYKEKIIRNIANFIVKMYVGEGYYVNFADCSALPGRRSSREFLFGKNCEDDVLAGFAAEDFRSETKNQQMLSDEINLFYHCMQAFAYEEMMQFPVSKEPPRDTFFESMGLMVARDRHYTLAAKAGNNADSHNHNDVGSFTIYKDGKPFVIDLGVGTYTQKTFSDKRYELWTMQSQFHNLPTFFTDEINSDLGKDSAADYYNSEIVMQKDGEKYAAQNVNCILCNNTDTGVSSLQMDIAATYDSEHICSYLRTVSLEKGKYITVKDKYVGDFPYVMSIMTYEKPEVHKTKDDAELQKETAEIKKDSTASAEKNNDEIVIIKVGTIGKIEFKNVKDIIIQEYPINDERLKNAWKHSVYRILFVPDKEFEATFI